MAHVDGVDHLRVTLVRALRTNNRNGIALLHAELFEHFLAGSAAQGRNKAVDIDLAGLVLDVEVAVLVVVYVS